MLYSFHRLENLECVSLDNNKLKNIPKELCFLQKLCELRLSHNSILALPEEIKYLTKLKILILSRNKIEELPDVSGFNVLWKNIS